MKLTFWPKVRSYVDLASQNAPSIMQFNISVCLKVERPYRNCFLRRLFTLTDGKIVIWAIPPSDLLTHKCHFEPTWEYYNIIRHFITSAGPLLTHDHWDYINLINDDPLDPEYLEAVRGA